MRGKNNNFTGYSTGVTEPITKKNYSYFLHTTSLIKLELIAFSFRNVYEFDSEVLLYKRIDSNEWQVKPKLSQEPL